MSRIAGRTGHWWDRLRLARGIASGIAFAVLVQSAAAARADDAAQSDAVRAFAEAYSQIKSRYAEPLDDKKLVANAIKGMIGGLDPFSHYLESEAYEGQRQDSAGAFGGLGMEVSMEKNAVKVISAFEDSPASHAGLQPGDLITRFGDTSVEGLTLEQAIQQARGAPDTSVALTILRSGEAQPRIVTLKRAVIQARSVRSAPIDPAYVYLQITHFNKNTAERLHASLAHAYEKNGALKGVVLDLRDNPGGLLRSAVAVSSLFLPEDALVVYTESASQESRMRLAAKDAGGASGGDYARILGSALKTVPLVVLVNGGSASASEIVAGALQSHKRATIVGARTFGKGTVQVVLPLADGSAMKLTTAYYYTPDGRRIQGTGVVPDLPVDALKAGTPALPAGDAQSIDAGACDAAPA
ncbi:MAG TPA: S41 family peptidase, partial [Burkholderiales bacterium]